MLHEESPEALLNSGVACLLHLRDDALCIYGDLRKLFERTAIGAAEDERVDNLRMKRIVDKLTLLVQVGGMKMVIYKIK